MNSLNLCIMAKTLFKLIINCVHYNYDTGLYSPVFRTLPRPRPEGLIEGTMDDISIPGGGPLWAGR